MKLNPSSVASPRHDGGAARDNWRQAAFVPVNAARVSGPEDPWMEGYVAERRVMAIIGLVFWLSLLLGGAMVAWLERTNDVLSSLGIAANTFGFIGLGCWAFSDRDYLRRRRRERH